MKFMLIVYILLHPDDTWSNR